MTRTARVFTGLAVAIALVGGGAYLFLRGDAPTSLAARTKRAEGPAAPAAATESADAVAARAAVEAPAPVPVIGPPPSYRAALGAFTGRLLEPDLAPAKGLKVSAVEFDLNRYLLDASVLLDEAHAPPPLESATGVSDDDGRFTLAGLEPRALQLLGIDLGGPRSTFRVIDRSPVSGETVDLGDIVLEPFVTFVGRVVNEDREPVSGARVRATNLPALIFQFGIEDIRRGCAILADVLGSPKVFEVPPVVWQYETLLPIPTALSDDEGKFTLKGIPLGMVSIVADKPGSKAGVKTQPSGRSAQRNVGDVVLTAGFTLGGTIVDGAQHPVADVEVMAGIRNPAVPIPAALMQPAGRTDARGAFRITGLPSGNDAYVATRTSRGQPWRVHGPLAAAESGLVVQLAPPSGFVVTLRDDAGKPVADAELFIAPDPLEGGVPLPPIFAPPMQKLTEVKDDGVGMKRVTGLDSGKYQLIGRAPGFALATASVSAADPPPPCELVFAASNVVDVTVVRASDRQPLEWAFASLAPKGIFERPVARARSDKTGHLKLDRVPAGEYVLSVHHPAQATLDLEVKVPAEPLTVALRLGGNLKGKLLDRGKPPGKSLFLVLIPKDAEKEAQRGALQRPDAAMPTFSASAETGEFVAMNLEVGDYRFEVRDRIVGKGPLALFQTMRDDPLAKGEFSIREGETTELVVDVTAGDGPTAELYGSVWMNGAPAPDVSVRFEGPKNRTVRTDADGNYRFDVLPAAKGKLLVQGLKDGDLFSLASVVHREEIELRPGESRRLDINLEVAAVRGRVTGPGPLPAALGTMVILRDTDGGASQMAMTNPLTGGYEFAHVPAGKFDLLVRQRGAAPFTTTLEVEPRRGDVNYDVVLQASITLRGVVVLPEGSPAAGDDGRPATLFLVDGEGRPAGRGSVDEKRSTFVFEDASAGEYAVRWYRQGQTLLVRKLAIPAGGASDVKLVFELPAEGEEVPPMFPNAPGPLGPRRTDRQAH